MMINYIRCKITLKSKNIQLILKGSFSDVIRESEGLIVFIFYFLSVCF